MSATSSKRRPRWRPMKTAPKDGTYILLAYPSFSDNGEVYVGHARWVDMPHEARVEVQAEAYQEALRSGRTDIKRPTYPTGKPHWETAYVAVREHYGLGYQGYAYRSQSVTIDEPLGWLPVPPPPKCSSKR